MTTHGACACPNWHSELERIWSGCSMQQPQSFHLQLTSTLGWAVVTVIHLAHCCTSFMQAAPRTNHRFCSRKQTAVQSIRWWHANLSSMQGIAREADNLLAPQQEHNATALLSQCCQCGTGEVLPAIACTCSAGRVTTRGVVGGRGSSRKEFGKGGRACLPTASMAVIPMPHAYTGPLLLHP